MKRWIVVLIAAMGVLASSAICMGEEDKRDEGMFSKGSFLSEAISSVTSKIDKVTSGEERVVDKDAKGIDKDSLEYDGDPFGRPDTAADRDKLRADRERMNQKQPSGGSNEK
jgi:hypothetical protein